MRFDTGAETDPRYPGRGLDPVRARAYRPAVGEDELARDRTDAWSGHDQDAVPVWSQLWRSVGTA
jgi:hypothetical protein